MILLRIKPSLILYLATFVASILLIAPTHGVIIYQDDFNNADEGGTPAGLGGDSPTIANNIYGGSSTATWGASTDGYWGSDGSKLAGTVNAFLPVNIPSNTSGLSYTLTCDITTSASSGNDWLAIGFATSTTGVFWDVGAPWAFLRGQTTDGSGTGLNSTPNTGQAYGNKLTNGGNLVLGTSNESGPYSGRFQIVIDTTSPYWLVKWSFMETGQTEFTEFHSYQYSISDPNPDITHVGIGGVANGAGSVDNFMLTVVPEPSWTTLSSLSVLLIIFRRKRNH